MIGVLAGAADRAAVEEFFELFKTPWEYYEEGRDYTALVCADAAPAGRVRAPLVVVYGSAPRPEEKEENPGFLRRQRAVLRWRGSRFPILGAALLRTGGAAEVAEDGTGLPVLWRRGGVEMTIVRVGYDLFAEIRELLRAGQPAEFAGSPTVDLHIGILRELVVGAAGTLVEIPAAPAGYRFLGCLTHDVDHPSLRRHRFDHTLAGFLYRATLGSLGRWLRGRLGWRGVLRNWAAAAKTPLVHLGVFADEWLEFTKYPEIERGFASTFFVIPFRGVAGRTGTGRAPRATAPQTSARSSGSCAPPVVRLGCTASTPGSTPARPATKRRPCAAPAGAEAGCACTGCTSRKSRQCG